MCGRTQHVSQTLRDILQQEDSAFEELLLKERSDHQLWARTQTDMLDDMLEHQAHVSRQVVSLRREALSQQDALDQVVQQVRAVMAQYGVDRGSSLASKPGMKDPRSLHDSPSSRSADGKSGEASEDDEHAGTHAQSSSRWASETTVDLVHQLYRRTWDGKGESFLSLVTTPLFNGISTLVILLNAVLIGVTVEYQLDHVNEEVPAIFRGLEWSFYAFYFIELVLKLLHFRQEFFCNTEWAWNMFDSFLVLMAVYDVIMFYVEHLTGSSGVNVTFMRLLRLLKMLKMLRVVRVMRFFRELRLMVYSISRSVRSLLWAMAMLVLIMYIFALCFMQAATTYLNEKPAEAVSQEMEEAIAGQWLTVHESLLSLFEAITGGDDWGNFLTTCSAFGDLYHYLFIFYIMFQTIAVLNVLTGIFVDASMDAAQTDQENIVHETTQNTTWRQDVLQNLFFGKDTTHQMSEQEFLEVLENETLQTYLQSLDIDVVEAREMFKELDLDNDLKVDVQELREGLMRMNGTARSIDMVALSHESKIYSSQLDIFMAFVQDYFSVIQNELHKRLGKEPWRTEASLSNWLNVKANPRIGRATSPGEKPLHPLSRTPEEAAPMHQSL